MYKKISVVAILLIAVVFLILYVRDIGIELPSEGVYYCDELMMYIDFSILSEGDPECVSVYDENGASTIVRCMIDYGNGVWIVSKDQQTTYVLGAFSNKDGVFTITTHDDGTVYVFDRIE